MAKKKESNPPGSHFYSLLILGLSTAALMGGSVLDTVHRNSSDNLIWKPLLNLHDSYQLSFGQNQLGDIYITRERMIQKDEVITQERMMQMTEALNSYAEQLNTPLYLMLIPTAEEIYGDTLPVNMSQDSSLWKTMSEQLNDRVIQINVKNALMLEKEQYIYYRTDPCWTSYGAYTAYQTTIRKLGFQSIGYDQFVIHHVISDYYGALSDRIQYYDIQPDIIDVYLRQNDATVQNVTALRMDETKKIASYCNEDAVHSEDVFAFSREPVIRIDTENSANKNLLLLTDAYGSHILPFLSQHYHSVTAVNLPLCRDNEIPWQQIADAGYSQTIILCGADTAFSQDGLCEILKGNCAAE
ncbi:MAG: DHHW family protein [Oscillospiraceae bacterium]|nr:DHHW family protein [Oscillospiraceae bacterium]